MGHQYIHTETYARKASKQKKGGLSVRDVAAEALREEGNTPHIETPKPPIFYLGDMETVEKEAKKWGDQATDSIGRKLREDGHCLLAGVISLPRDEETNWDKFAELSLDYLQNKYGNRLKCVLAHKEDEAHPHLHFYVVPNIGEKFEDIHQGQKAANQAKTDGKLKGAQNLAYQEAMRVYQDEFSEEVGRFLGLTRLGPGRRRLSRGEWKKEQQQAKYLSNLKGHAKKGYADGFKKGYRKAVDETETLGKKIGGVIAGVLGGLHKPTNEALQEIENLKKKTEEQARKHSQELQKTQAIAKAERSTVEEELARKTREVTSLKQDLKTSEEARNKASELAGWYENRGEKPKNLTSPK